MRRQRLKLKFVLTTRYTLYDLYTLATRYSLLLKILIFILKISSLKPLSSYALHRHTQSQILRLLRLNGDQTNSPKFNFFHHDNQILSQQVTVAPFLDYTFQEEILKNETFSRHNNLVCYTTLQYNSSCNSFEAAKKRKKSDEKESRVVKH